MKSKFLYGKTPANNDEMLTSVKKGPDPAHVVSRVKDLMRRAAKAASTVEQIKLFVEIGNQLLSIERAQGLKGAGYQYVLLQCKISKGSAYNWSCLAKCAAYNEIEVFCGKWKLTALYRIAKKWLAIQDAENGRRRPGPRPRKQKTKAVGTPAPFVRKPVDFYFGKTEKYRPIDLSSLE